MGVCRLRLTAGLLAIVAGCQTPSHPQAKQQAEQRWNEVRARVKLQLGRQQCEGGLFAEAVGTLSEALRLDPQQLEAYILLARANLELSKLASAQEVLDAARVRGLDAASWHYTQAVLFEQRNQLDAAVAEYELARSMDPTQVDYVLALAECLVDAGQPARAARLLEESLHRFDDSASVAALAGHVALLAGDEELASNSFGLAVVDSGSHPVILEQRGLLLAKAGRCKEAIALLGPLALGGEPAESGSVRRALAGCELALGNPSSATSWLLEFCASAPGDAAAQLLLAQAAMETGDLRTADRALQAAEQQSPDRPEVRLARAAWHWRRGEYPVAADFLYAILERDPTVVDAYCLLAEVLIRLGQPDAAEDSYRRALNLDPSCTWALRGLEHVAAALHALR